MEQLRTLAVTFLELNTQANNICMVFFGVYCLLIGYLIFRWPSCLEFWAC